MGMPCLQLETPGNLNGFTFTYARNVKLNMPDLSGKLHFGKCWRWCQTRRNIFTFSCKQCFHISKEYEMNHVGSLSYDDISGKVRKILLGVVDNFLFQLVNTLSPLFSKRQCIVLNENVWILIKISLKFVSEGPINNISALIPIMVWHQSGDEPLSESMMA